MKTNKKQEERSLAYGETDVAGYRKTKRKRTLCIVLCVIFICITALFCFGRIGCLYSDTTLRFWRPDYPQTDISALLEKELLTEKEYELLYRQTGLTKLGIEDMRHDEEGRSKILQIQECMFRDYDLITRNFGLFTYTEELGTRTEEQFCAIAKLRDGDILVSSSMYVAWWRLGHSALVVDGEEERILEAIKPGYKSEISHVDVYSYRVNFILLRPKLSETVKANVVEYAKKELVGVKYSLFTGIFNKKFTTQPKTSNCGHIVWRAYKEYGVDIDANGGKLVLPKDIYRSEYMEVVQVFGLDLDKLWQ